MRNVPNRLMVLMLAVLLSSFVSLRNAQAEDKVLTGTTLTGPASLDIKEINQTASTIVTVTGQIPQGETKLQMPPGQTSMTTIGFTFTWPSTGIIKERYDVASGT